MRYVLVLDTNKAEMDRATPELIEQVARRDVAGLQCCLVFQRP
jgi:hypothetical protein